MLKMLLPLASLALAACAAIPPGESGRTIYVMRHLNTPAGSPDPDITAEGQENAGRVADWFATRKLDAIVVSSAKRAGQSIAPLATAKRLTPIAYDPRDGAALIARVQAMNGNILVVGHSNTVPDIVEQLGGERPADIPHEQFGDIWEIRADTTIRHRVGN